MSRNKQAVKLAQELGISYVEALRRVRQQYLEMLALEELFPEPEDLLPDAIESRCKGLVGNTVWHPSGSNLRGAIRFDEVDLPYDVLDAIFVSDVVPDLDEARWWPTGGFDEGEKFGDVDVTAEVTLTGYGLLSLVKNRADLTITNPDFGGSAEVRLQKQVRLRWDGVVHRPGADWIDLDWPSVLPLWPDTADLHY